MSQQLRQEWNQPSQAESACGLVNELLDAGGVSLKSISWKTGQSDDQELAQAAISLTLDLLENSAISSGTADRFRKLWPDNCWPLILTSSGAELNPGISPETHREIIREINSPRVDERIHSLRLADNENPDFNRALFGSALPFGPSLVILGVVYSESNEPVAPHAERLTELITQLCSNQSLISALSGRNASQQCMQTLINPASKEVVWRNQTALDHWRNAERFVNYLINARSGSTSAEHPGVAKRIGETVNTAPERILSLALVTFLRPIDHNSGSAQRALSEIERGVTNTGSGLPASVRSRIEKTLNVAGAEHLNNTSTNAERILAGDVSRKIITDPRQGTAPANSETAGGAKEENNSARDGKEKAADRAKPETKKRSKSRTALEIALSRLPGGGKLRLSKDDLTGEMFFESIDKGGDPLVAISLQQDPQDAKQDDSDFL